MRKSKNEQGVALVILVVFLVVAATVVYGGAKIMKKPINLPGLQLPTGNNSEETIAPTEGMEPQISPKQDLEEPESQPVLVENFDRTGNLTDWDANAERETGDWILLYEEPGRPAIVANLTFNTFSKCDLGSGEEVCDKSKLELGVRARVQGNEKEGKVTVIKLTKIAGP
jgi:hypothetical protein